MPWRDGSCPLALTKLAHSGGTVFVPFKNGSGAGKIGGGGGGKKGGGATGATGIGGMSTGGGGNEMIIASTGGSACSEVNSVSTLA